MRNSPSGTSGLPYHHSLISGLVQRGQAHQALDYYQWMKQEGLSPSLVTLRCLLKACGTIRALNAGKQIHEEILGKGLLHNDALLGTALIDMYAKCGNLVKAQEVHDDLCLQDVVSWSALIAGYAHQGHGQEALDCFVRMQAESICPNAITFVSILKACGMVGAVEEGTAIHNRIVNSGLLEKHIMLGTALVDMYMKCGAITKARQVHDELHSRDVVSWSALIAGYAQQAQGNDALKCFKQMQHEGISANVVTFICILKVCGSMQDVHQGRYVHDEIVCRGEDTEEKDVSVGIALVDMYSKCSNLVEAQLILDKLSVRNVASWNALITGYTQQGHGFEALQAFDRMQNEGLSPDAITFTCILNSIGNTGAIGRGKRIHNEIMSMNLLDSDIVLGNALVDMYAKCGSIERAQQVFEGLPVRNVVSWSSLIAGYAQQGQGHEALNYFEQMQGEGLCPDAMMFLSVLNACSHAGFIHQAQTFFENMVGKYGILPNLEHHTCMVALLACTGHLEKAILVIKGMPSSKYVPVWLALLCACKKWGNVELARLAFYRAIQLDHCCTAAYVLMRDIYTAACMQVSAAKIEAMQHRISILKRHPVGVESI